MAIIYFMFIHALLTILGGENNDNRDNKRKTRSGAKAGG